MYKNTFLNPGEVAKIPRRAEFHELRMHEKTPGGFTREEDPAFNRADALQGARYRHACLGCA